MNDDTNKQTPPNEMTPAEERAAMEVAQEWAARDQFNKSHDQLRPRDSALEKWGPRIEAEIQRRQEMQRNTPEKAGLDLDRE